MSENKEKDFEYYQGLYEEIDDKAPNFWRWVGIIVVTVLFLFALPYLIGHIAKTLREYRNLRVAVKELKSS